MSLRSPVEDSRAAYRAGATVLLGSTGIILLALAFEYIGGYKPCELCLQQRYAYYAAIPATFLALVLMSARLHTLAMAVLALVALAYIANAGLAVYQAGAEWKFWPGPSTCSAPGDLSKDVGDLMRRLRRATPIRCDEASWRFLGLSFAGWNVLISLALSAMAVTAARALKRR